MNSRIKTDVAVFVGLVALGVGTRLIPVVTSLESWNLNFVWAAALFAGFYFTNRVVAIAVPMLSMLLGDAVAGRYDLRLMAAVYLAILVPVLIGPWVRRRFNVVRVGTGAVATALTFFIVTNFAHWCCLEEHTVDALVLCYVRAVPFGLSTLASTLLGSGILFGAYAILADRRAVEIPAASANVAV